MIDHHKKATKSPHELRTESENLSWEQDRPAKRQRIEPLLERRAQTSNVVPQRVSFNFQDSHQGMEDFGRLLCSELKLKESHLKHNRQESTIGPRQTEKNLQHITN